MHSRKASEGITIFYVFIINITVADTLQEREIM